MSEESYFCPMPCRYGTIRIDPVASAQHLNDPIAEKEAQGLRTQTYICYLELERQLPFPDEPWYRFAVALVGPRIRPANRKQALTPDMCTPIYPNEAHPTGRVSLHPEPAFPFKNCYFWYRVGLDVRIRSKPDCGLFDATHAICLPVDERFVLSSHASHDRRRQYARLRNRRKNKVALRHYSAHVDNENDNLEDEECVDESDSDVESLASDASNSDCSDYSKDSDATRSEVSLLTADALANMNIFGYPDQGVFNHPIVDFSHDLQEHLDEDNLPNPMDMLAERDALLEYAFRNISSLHRGNVLIVTQDHWESP
ncbi:hypothetical protein C2E23DRAFT_261375 [Lenzites betulinus]|nr:hypothetical protein C2E23DRAFT_261375 [Lenzites betulinus]